MWAFTVGRERRVVACGRLTWQLDLPLDRSVRPMFDAGRLSPGDLQSAGWLGGRDRSFCRAGGFTRKSRS
jgi:hypothetical protein